MYENMNVNSLYNLDFIFFRLITLYSPIQRNTPVIKLLKVPL